MRHKYLFASCPLTSRDSARGTALVVAVLATLVLAAFGSALVLISVTETGISAYHERAAGALYAADAALERAIVDLFALADWNAALSGLATSTLTDGLPSGVRLLSGTQVDIDAISSELRCGRRDGCGEADLDAFTAERPWGVDNPRWQLFAWGPLSRMMPAVAPAHDAYVLVWVGDDAGDADGNPLQDGNSADNPGSGIVQLTVQAYGPGGVRRILEATVARRVRDDGQPDPGAVPRVVVWRAVP